MSSSIPAPARGLASISIASHTSLLPFPSVSAIPVPRSPFSPLNKVTAKLYSEFVWTESVPAPGGRGKRASHVEIERIVESGIVLRSRCCRSADAITTAGQHDALSLEIIRHGKYDSPSCRTQFWQNDP